MTSFWRDLSKYGGTPELNDLVYDTLIDMGKSGGSWSRLYAMIADFCQESDDPRVILLNGEIEEAYNKEMYMPSSSAKYGMNDDDSDDDDEDNNPWKPPKDFGTDPGPGKIQNRLRTFTRRELTILATLLVWIIPFLLFLPGQRGQNLQQGWGVYQPRVDRPRLPEPMLPPRQAEPVRLPREPVRTPPVRTGPECPVPVRPRQAEPQRTRTETTCPTGDCEERHQQFLERQRQAQHRAREAYANELRSRGITDEEYENERIERERARVRAEIARRGEEAQREYLRSVNMRDNEQYINESVAWERGDIRQERNIRGGEAHRQFLRSIGRSESEYVHDLIHGLSLPYDNWKEDRSDT